MFFNILYYIYIYIILYYLIYIILPIVRNPDNRDDRHSTIFHINQTYQLLTMAHMAIFEFNLRRIIVRNSMLLRSRQVTDFDPDFDLTADERIYDAGLKQHSTKNEDPPKKTHHVFRADVAVFVPVIHLPADPVYEECELLHLELTNGVPGRPHQPACGSTPRCPAGPTKSHGRYGSC